MVVWHYQLKGHEFQQAPGGGEGQGSLVCYSPWGHKESDTTQQPMGERIQGLVDASDLILRCFPKDDMFKISYPPLRKRQSFSLEVFRPVCQGS